MLPADSSVSVSAQIPWLARYAAVQNSQGGGVLMFLQAWTFFFCIKSTSWFKAGVAQRRP
mgnify:CR=1 FL=1